MFDFDDPFYRPLRIRIAILLVCFGWGSFELSTGGIDFGILFLALVGFSAYRFFVTFNPDQSDRGEN